jgi:hypothetical protein
MYFTYHRNQHNIEVGSGLVNIVGQPMYVPTRQKRFNLENCV